MPLYGVSEIMARLKLSFKITGQYHNYETNTM